MFAKNYDPDKRRVFTTGGFFGVIVAIIIIAALVAITLLVVLPSTEEAEDNCAAMAAKELVDYLENGNIKNSVNFPNAEMNAVGSKICILHKNIPAVIAPLTAAISNAGGNIENMVNASRKDYAYTMIDVTGADAESIAEGMKSIEGVIRVRVIG